MDIDSNDSRNDCLCDIFSFPGDTGLFIRSAKAAVFIIKIRLCRSFLVYGTADLSNRYSSDTRRNHQCDWRSKLWQRMGWPLFLCTLVIMLFLRGQGEAVTGTVGAALVGIQIGFMLLSIVFTERALKKNFDGNGEPTSH